MATIDTACIRSGNECEVAQYLRDLSRKGDVENTTQQLIDAVGRGSIPPSTLKIWLSISHGPAVLKKALQQQTSVRIRKIAIEQLEKLLKSRNWKETWDGFGAVEGFTHLFQSLSASDVQDICHAIGSSTKGEDSEKREAITDLFKTLETQTLDTRPLAECYQYLLPGCTKSQVAKVVDTPTQENNHRKQDLLLRNHPYVLRDNLLKMVLDFDGPDRPWLFALLQNYPATPAAARPHLSSSMEFALEVLRSLVKDDQVPQISDEAFVLEVSQPLLIRCLKRGVAVETLKEVVGLTTKYIQRHPSVVRVLQLPKAYYWDESKEKAKFIEILADSWLRMPEIFEDLFRLVMRTLKLDRYSQEVSITAFNALLKKSALKFRYELLKFCIRFSTLKKDEIEISFDEALARTKSDLGSDTNPELKPEEFLDLLKRLRKAKNDKVCNRVYIGSSAGLFSLGTGESTEHDSYLDVDLDLWQVYYLQQASQQEEAEKLARLRIAERKKAQSTPDEQYRLLHAKGVVYYAIASGSLSILADAVNWTRRLIRDPNISIFKETPETIYKVLSGLPSSIGNDASVLRTRVKEANRIMSDLCDIVSSGLKDPAFEISNWREAFEFPHRVIYERVLRSAEFKEYFSDEDIYSILWEDTLKLLIDLEQKVIDNVQMRDADEHYYQTGLRDFRYQYGSSRKANSAKAHPSVYRFFDTLAKERNELWKKHRISKCPEVANLAEPFPQGLPVQYLIPFILLPSPPPEDLIPYISLRAKAAVFPPAEVSRTVISTKGDFSSTDPLHYIVEDYQYALNLYLCNDIAEQERRKRFNAAWAHAIGPLSEGRMTNEQAVRYWRPSFSSAIFNPEQSDNPWHSAVYLSSKSLPEEEKGIFKKDIEWLQSLTMDAKPEPLRIPFPDDATSILDWDATPEHKAKVDPQELPELTYIDISKDSSVQRRLEKYIESRDKDHLGDISNPKVPGRTYWYNSIWTQSGDQKAKSSFQAQEAQILSALLYLQTKTQVSDQLLPSPFPSADDIRYPASQLSTACLSKLNVAEEKATSSTRRRRGGGRERPKTTKGLKPNAKTAIRALEAQLSFVPPALILKLAEDALSSLGSVDRDDPNTDFPALEALAYNLLRILARSDRPNLALKPAIGIISKYPAACFWFKTVFSQGFFRDLTPQEANDGMTKFSETVSSLLDRMETAKESKKTKPTDEKPSAEETDTGAKDQDPEIENPEASVEEPESEVPKAEPGFVKVSTIKLLVELFEDADFLPKESPLSNIHTLAKITSNSDIYRTVIYYLTRVLKSPQPLDPEFFSILLTLAAKNSEVDIYRLMLQLVNFGLKSSKFDTKHQSLAVSVISSIYEKSTDVEITKQILEFFTLALDTPLSKDTATQALFLSMVLKISKGTLDSKLRDDLVVYLLRLLKMSTSEGYDQILDVLKELVSNCGNINETEPVTEAQWKTFEETLELPNCDIQTNISDASNPLLQKLIKFHKESRKFESLNLNTSFIEKIMIPIIKELNSQCSKYLSIFLRQNGISSTDQETFKLLPRIIVNLITTVLQDGVGEGLVPLLDEYISHAIFNFDPPEVLQQLNKKCDEDTEFKKLKAAKYWLNSFTFGPAALDDVDTNLISFIRERVGTPDEETAGTVVREQYLKLYKAIFLKEAKEPTFSSSDGLLQELEPQKLDTVWLKYLQPILQDILSFIESLRTTEWEQSLDRDPQILPDIFKPKLWLSNIPSIHRNDQDQETRCQIFTEEVLKVLDDISKSYEFVSKVSDLESILHLTHNDNEDDLVVAARLGDLATVETIPMSIQNYTRIKLASKMVCSLRPVKSEVLKEKIDNTIESWKYCQVEAVRRLGYSAKSPKLKVPTEETAKPVEEKREPRCVQKRSGRTKIRQKGKNSRWGPPVFTLEKPEKPTTHNYDSDWW
ncbi:hypothetical protein TWF506_009763 [Arthrobotrys conoides]|uniref:Uncharacterized protein n=1 Tax=Arthrobotrys conoides TaxID=74498 RepID=A0AAN8NG07_9PEZI